MNASVDNNQKLKPCHVFDGTKMQNGSNGTTVQNSKNPNLNQNSTNNPTINSCYIGTSVCDSKRSKHHSQSSQRRRCYLQESGSTRKEDSARNGLNGRRWSSSNNTDVETARFMIENGMTTNRTNRTNTNRDKYSKSSNGPHDNNSIIHSIEEIEDSFFHMNSEHNHKKSNDRCKTDRTNLVATIESNLHSSKSHFYDEFQIKSDNREKLANNYQSENNRIYSRDSYNTQNNRDSYNVNNNYAENNRNQAQRMADLSISEIAYTNGQNNARDTVNTNLINTFSTDNMLIIPNE